VNADFSLSEEESYLKRQFKQQLFFDFLFFFCNLSSHQTYIKIWRRNKFICPFPFFQKKMFFLVSSVSSLIQTGLEVFSTATQSNTPPNGIDDAFTNEISLAPRTVCLRFSFLYISCCLVF
jgi:hypothetical protein